MSQLPYIDSYFNKELSSDEKKQFEQKIADDPEFAGEVAFYCSAMTAVKEELTAEKKKQFRNIYDDGLSEVEKPRPAVIKKWWPYMAAAAAVAAVILGWYIFTVPSSPQQLAEQYIKQNFEQIGIKMTGTEDSLDKATRLYNENKLPEALQQFEAISEYGTSGYAAKKMAGIVYLRLGEYDKALDYFARIEKLSLYSNPGKFYRALTLIKRNLPGDKPLAKQLLLQVVQEDLEGKEPAEKWLKSL